MKTGVFTHSVSYSVRLTGARLCRTLINITGLNQLVGSHFHVKRMQKNANMIVMELSVEHSTSRQSAK